MVKLKQQLSLQVAFQGNFQIKSTVKSNSLCKQFVLLTSEAQSAKTLSKIYIASDNTVVHKH